MTLLQQFKEVFPTCGMTQHELSEKSGISQTSINMWLRGKRNNPECFGLECVFEAMDYEVKAVKR